MIFRKFSQAACFLFLAMNVCRVSATDLKSSLNLDESTKDSLITSGPVLKIVSSDGCSIITARSGNGNSQDAAKAFDNATSTKWYCYHTSGVIWLQYQYCNGASFAVNSYTLTSGNDMPLRDPKTLNLLGSNDGVNYTLLDYRTNIVFTARYQTLTFAFTNTAQFKYYKFEFAANPGNDGLQLSEIELMGAGTTTTVPSSPTSLVTTPVSSSGISLSWKDNSSDETGFEIYRSETPGSGFTLINTAGTNISAYTDGGLAASSIHYYKVRAANQAGFSGYTSEVPGTTLSGSSVTVCTDGCSMITARGGNGISQDAAKAFDNSTSTKWYNFQTAGSIWLQYQFCNSDAYAVNSYSLTSANDMPVRDPKTAILYGSNDGVNYTAVDSRNNIAFSARFQKQTFSFSNTTAYKYYKFEFAANAGNDGLQLSEIELMSSGSVPPGSGPAAPSGLTTLFNASELIGLSWTDNSSDEASFVIEQSLNSSFSPLQTSYTLAGNTTKNVVKGLTPNTTYYFRIKSTNGSGNSAYSSVMTVKTNVADNFPLAMSSGKLVTKTGSPFLIVGDSPWSLIVGPNMAGTDKYLENRRQKGVNSIIANLVEHYYNGPADAYGNLPFLVTGDFSTPNPKYFDNADYVIGKAREKGIAVFLFPAYLGYDDGGSHVEGWYTEINANGTSRMYQYGRYLGQRYKDFKNIVWVMGGDCAPGTTIDEIREIVRGIEETAGPQIFTVHNGRYQSGLTSYSGEAWVDLNNTYACKATTASYLQTDYQRNYPFFYIEGTYENLGITAANLRGQMYLPLLMGANGYFFGNYPLFEFTSGWDDPSVLESQGSLDLQRSGEMLKSRAWNNLVPDLNHTLLTGGYGDISSATYAAAALTKDAGSAIIYVPDYRKLTVDLTRISGTQTHAWWYQPSNGYVVDASNYNDITAQAFYPPSTATDWLLILDDASLGYDAPGTANPLLKSTEGKETPGLKEPDPSTGSIYQDFIYPNPAREQFHIMNDVSAEASVSIYDMQGKMIMSQQVYDNTVDISDLPYGIYIVKLIDADKIMISRLVKE
jgi:hypothetical protein